MKSYSVGALVAQGSHASIAAIEKYHDHLQTMSYVKDLGNMTTVVYQMTGNDVETIKSNLDMLKIEYYEWIEDADIVTCICTRPIDLSNNKGFIEMKKTLKLFR